MADRIPQDVIEADARALVLETKRHFKQLRIDNHLEDEWLAAETSYFNGSDDFYQGVSKVRIPALHNSVERIVPKLDKVIFPPDGNFFEAKAKNENDQLEIQQALITTSLIKDQFFNIGVRGKLIGVYRSLCIYGTVFIKSFWNHKEKKRFVREGNERVENFEVIMDDPDFYSPNIRDMYADPKDEDLEGAVIEEIITNYQDLWRLRKRKEDGEEIGIYDNVEDVKGSWIRQETDTEKGDSEEKRGLAEHKYSDHEQKVRVLEYWGPVPKYYFTGSQQDKDNLETVENALIVIAESDNSGVTLRISENPFDHQEKPYQRARYIKVDGRLYGLGVMSVNIPLEMELNTLRNQLMDLRTFMLKTKWLKDRNAEISEAQLTDLFNQVIDTTDVNGLVPLRPTDFSGSAIANEQNIKSDIEDGTGATKFLGGTPTGSSLERTAAGVSTLFSSGLERFELVTTTFQEELLKPLVEKFWQLDQQFLPEGRDVKLIGQELIRVVPSEIGFNFDINFVGAKELGEKGFKLNSLNILIQNVSPFIPLGLDPLPIIKEFFKLANMPNLAKEVFAASERAQLEGSPQGELQLLASGRKVKIDINDDHDAFLAAYQQLLNQSDIDDNVRQNVLEATGQRLLAKEMVRLTEERARQTNNRQNA